MNPSPIDRLADALDRRDALVSRHGDQITARCPAHEDRNASLSVGVGRDGRALVHCHAGCDTLDVLDALGLSWGDLFPDDGPKPWTTDGLRRVGASVEQDGRVRFGTVRYLPGATDGAKKSIADAGKARELYPDPATVRGDVLYVVEGEPDAATGSSLELPTVAVPGAAGWRPEWGARLAEGRRRVVVISDSDPQGRKAAQRVAAGIAEHCPDVRVLDLAPDRSDGFDLSDYAAEGHTARELVQLAEQAPSVGGAQSEAPSPAVADWIIGEPMDPEGVPAEPLPLLPGAPFLHAGTSAIVSGPTGGGRSALIQAVCYDAARAGLRVAYLGSEITKGEFDARSAMLAKARGDRITDELRAELARVRYLPLEAVVIEAWANPQTWIEGMSASYDLAALDPLSAVGAALGLAFDNANEDFVRFHDGLILPITTRGVAVVLVDNIGHGEDAKARPKGVSAKQDKPDLAFSCSRSVNPVGLIVKAQKVRPTRAAFKRHDEWLFTKDDQRIARRTEDSAAAWEPTAYMEKVSRAVEQVDGLTKRAIRETVAGKTALIDMAISLLIDQGYIEAVPVGKAHHHKSLRAYRAPDGQEIYATQAEMGHETHATPRDPQETRRDLHETPSHREPRDPRDPTPTGVGSGLMDSGSDEGQQAPLDLPDQRGLPDRNDPPGESLADRAERELGGARA
ncbi:MAG: hypothetical protein ACLQMH_13550 [Solirubrobacteraceae bacterium]